MRWSRWAVCLLALLCMCILICSAALADWQIEMNPVEWTWDANGVASFSGVIRTDGADVSGAVLSLAVDTRMEDSGEVLFTALNEKKVKLRKRSNTAEIDISGANAENTFEGEWYLPAEVEEGLASAVVHLTIADGEGKELAKYDMQAGSQEADTASESNSPTEKLDRLFHFLLFGGIGVWILALGRYAFLQRKRSNKA